MKKMILFFILLFFIASPSFSQEICDWCLYEWEIWDGAGDSTKDMVTCGFTQYRVPFGDSAGCLGYSFDTTTDDVYLKLSGDTVGSIFEIQNASGSFAIRFDAVGTIQTNNFYVTQLGEVTAEDGFRSQYQHSTIESSEYYANDFNYFSSVSQTQPGENVLFNSNASSSADGFRNVYNYTNNAGGEIYGNETEIIGTNEIGNETTGIYSHATQGTERNCTTTGIKGEATGGGGNPSTAYGVYGTATGANTNYSGYFKDGDFYIENELGVGDAVTIAKDVDNAEFGAFYVKNSNEPADGETGQEVSLNFQLMGTADGSTFDTETVGYFKVDKVDDFWNASGKSEHDARLEFGVMTNGSLLWNARMDGTGTTYNGTLFTNRINITGTGIVYDTANAIGIGYNAFAMEGPTANSYEGYLRPPYLVDWTVDTEGRFGVIYLETDVSNPPTAAELDAIFGAPGTVGKVAYDINDNGADTNFYHVVSDGTSWWIFTGTKAS